MQENAAIITADLPDDEIIEDVLNDVLDSAATSFTVHTESDHTDGYFADGSTLDLGPCPNCNGQDLSVMEITESHYRITPAGNSEYVERGEASGPTLNVLCRNCMTLLYEHPVNKILQYD